MEFNSTDFIGLYYIKPKLIGDDRGWFMRTYSEDIFRQNIPQFGNTKWVQTNHSYSKEKYTWRGFHFQRSPFQEIKLVRCITGSVIDYVIDLRKGSKTFLKIFEIELSYENKIMLLIPSGFAHAFLTKEENVEMLYQHNEFYNPEFESGIRYDDPIIKFHIPVTPQVVSNRDRTHKLLDINFNGI